MTSVMEGGDITYKDMVDEKQILGESEIQKFFSGATVLVTGGTGFLGKLLIEKLLRSCPDIKKIYLLARPKKNKDMEKRLQEQFDDVLYDKLRKINPDFTSKVGAIAGDVGQEQLGMSDEDRKTITNEVDVIFHGAATVRFDEPLKTAVQINVRGTRDMFILARACTHLRAFVHTSTAYSNCPRRHIGEEFYDSPLPADKLIDLAETLDHNVLENIKDGLLGDFPNTYAFTKAVAEDIVKNYSKGLPVAMIRPSIVIATNKEPVAGWIDNVYGPTGVVVGAAIGLLHSLYCDPQVLADLVPGDMVVHATIAAAWRAAKDFPSNHEEAPQDLPPPIYNYVSSEQQPLTWASFMKHNEVNGMTVPTLQAVWYYLLVLTPSRFVYFMCTALMHWLPAYIVDGVAVLIGKKPMLVKAYTKIHKFSEVISYFCTQQWKFSNNNTQQLFAGLCSSDQQLFSFDISTLDWIEYFNTYVKGVRVYLIKDPLDTVPQGLKKHNRLKVAHYVCTAIFGVLVLSVLWKCFSFTMSLLY